SAAERGIRPRRRVRGAPGPCAFPFHTGYNVRMRPLERSDACLGTAPPVEGERNGALRLLLYNIRYAAGADRQFHLPVPYSGYLKRTTDNLARITRFIKSAHADIVGL